VSEKQSEKHECSKTGLFSPESIIFQRGERFWIVGSFDANLLPKKNALETRYFDDCYETNQARINSVDLMAKV
jgi:hypothetical protein